MRTLLRSSLFVGLFTLAASAGASPRGPYEPRHEAAPRAHAQALHVARLVVARGVQSREPVGVDTVFGASEKRLFAFVEIDNAERLPGVVRVSFFDPAGAEQEPVALDVGDGARWRTWAFTRRAHTPGMWSAVVRDERGTILASTDFEVR
jgi:hypothetical protein